MNDLTLQAIKQPSKQLNNQKPVIVVTGPRKTWKFGWWATRFQLWRVGLRGVYVCPGSERFPARLHGVIIGGGDDIDPSHYGENSPAEARYDMARDSLELSVIELAEQWGLPILGICRGAQLINVARKGSLIADLRPLRRKTPNRNSLFPIKFANIKPDSHLASILNTSRLKVNSLHHQAINQVGEGLLAVAHDEDEFVQAIEASGKRFLLGVQWHPEYLPFRLPQTNLFSALKQAAYDYADK